MRKKWKTWIGVILLIGWIGCCVQPAHAQANDPSQTPTPVPKIYTSEELLQVVNAARLAIGHPKLVLDPILMSYVQGEADKAANSIPSNGKTAVENVIALGYGYPETIDTIFCTSSISYFSINAPNPLDLTGFGTSGERAVNNIYYAHIGFGISLGTGDWDGYIFYLLTACYTADKKYKPGQLITPGSNTPAAVSEVIIPVRTARPSKNGQIIHQVLSGQTLWAIAMAYNVHINDILTLNQLAADTTSVYQGQKLLIPTSIGGIHAVTLTPQASPRNATLPILPTSTPSKINISAPTVPTSSSIPSITPTSTAQPVVWRITNESIIIGVILICGLVFGIGTFTKK